MDELTLRPACPGEEEAAAALYRASVGRPGCTWDAEYPTREDAAFDLSRGCLYVACLGDPVVGAVSAVPENELDELPCWQAREGAREIARVVIAPACRGKGYGGEMVAALLEVLRGQGCRAVHLLAALLNPAARALYARLGFVPRGETPMFGHDYEALELIFSGQN